jgi:hypothetical protein
MVGSARSWKLIKCFADSHKKAVCRCRVRASYRTISHRRDPLFPLLAKYFVPRVPVVLTDGHKEVFVGISLLSKPKPTPFSISFRPLDSLYLRLSRKCRATSALGTR